VVCTVGSRDNEYHIYFNFFNFKGQFHANGRPEIGNARHGRRLSDRLQAAVNNQLYDEV